MVRAHVEITPTAIVVASEVVTGACAECRVLELTPNAAQTRPVFNQQTFGRTPIDELLVMLDRFGSLGRRHNDPVLCVT